MYKTKRVYKSRNYDKFVRYIWYKNFGQKFVYYSQLISSTFCMHDHAHDVLNKCFIFKFYLSILWLIGLKENELKKASGIHPVNNSELYDGILVRTVCLLSIINPSADCWDLYKNRNRFV